MSFFNKLTRLLSDSSSSSNVAPPPPQIAQWMDDDFSNCCLVCGKEFSLAVRRHHCRVCLRLVCGDCSSRTLPVEREDGKVKGERACDECVDSAEAEQGIHMDAEDAVALERGADEKQCVCSVYLHLGVNFPPLIGAATQCLYAEVTGAGRVERFDIVPPFLPSSSDSRLCCAQYGWKQEDFQQYGPCL